MQSLCYAEKCCYTVTDDDCNHVTHTDCEQARLHAAVVSILAHHNGIRYCMHNHALCMSIHRDAHCQTVVCTAKPKRVIWLH